MLDLTKWDIGRKGSTEEETQETKVTTRVVSGLTSSALTGGMRGCSKIKIEESCRV